MLPDLKSLVMVVLPFLDWVPMNLPMWSLMYCILFRIVTFDFFCLDGVFDVFPLGSVSEYISGA